MKITSGQFIDQIEKFNNSNGQFGLIRLPMQNIKSAGNLDTLKKCNTAKLKNKFAQKQLNYQELLLVLRYKLSAYVGLLPYKLANKTGLTQQQQQLLDNCALDIFKNERNVTVDSLLKSYSDVCKMLKSTRQITLVDNITIERQSVEQVYQLKLPASFLLMKAKFGKSKLKAEKLKTAIDTIGKKRRDKWLDMTCKMYGLDMHAPEVTSIYAEAIGDDKTIDTSKHFARTLDGLANAMEDTENKYQYAFYTLKLFKKGRIIKIPDIPSGVGLTGVLPEFKSIVDIENTLTGGSIDTQFYLNESTRKVIDEKLQKLKRKDLDNEDKSIENVATDENEKPTKKRRFSLSLESGKPKRLVRNLRSRSVSVPRSSGAVSSEETANKASPSMIKYRASRLLKIEDDDKLEAELDNLSQNYSNDEREQKNYREQLAKRVRLNQFVKKEEETLKKCFEIAQQCKEAKCDPSKLPVETSDFYMGCALKSQKFDNFKISVFNRYYTDDSQWISKKKVMGSILEEHYFNLKSLLLLTGAPTGGETKKINLSNRIIASSDPNKGTTYKTIEIGAELPASYQALQKNSMRIINESFKYADNHFKPEATKKFNELKNLLSDPTDAAEFQSSLTEITFASADKRKNIILNWERLFEGADKEEYEKAYNQYLENVVSNTHQSVANAKGKLYTLLSFIWLICYDLNLEIRKEAFNSLIKQLDVGIQKARQKSEKSKKFEGSVSPGHLPPEAINMPPANHLPKDVLEESLKDFKKSKAEAQDTKPGANLSSEEQERFKYLTSLPTFMLNQRQREELQKLKVKKELNSKAEAAKTSNKGSTVAESAAKFEKFASGNNPPSNAVRGEAQRRASIRKTNPEFERRRQMFANKPIMSTQNSK